jgi:8-oxo-dGTP pyrophosphatase MutT (NUDIX family)
MAWIEDEDQKVLLVRQALGLRLWTLPGGKVKRGESLVKSDIPAEKSFAIRQILLVGQERPSQEGFKNSGCDSPIPRDRVKDTGLYHVNDCLQQTGCGSAARTEMRFPAVYEQADRARRRR